MRRADKHIAPALVLGLAGLLTWISVPLSAAAQGYLYNRADFPVGNNPSGVITADFNGDGMPDLAVTNMYDNTVSILLSKPGAGFAAQAIYPTGKSPVAIVAADFNGDGKPDLAIVNNADNTVSVLLGTGAGQFGQQVTYATGAAPTAIVAADFNGDGKIDLAISNQNDGTVSILLGNGDGTFQNQTTVTVNGSPPAIALGDFNGDGKPDLITTSGNFGNAVTVLLNNGDGTFTRKDTLYVGVGPGSVAVGDFNGDGRLDAVVTEYGNNGVPLLVLGNGDGTFQRGVPITSSTIAPKFVVARDFNGDGKPDLACVAIAMNNPGVLSPFVSVFLGNGDGTFTEVSSSTEGAAAIALAVGDFNGDGHPDFAVAATGNEIAAQLPGFVSVLLGNGDGTFDKRADFALPQALAIGPSVVQDFNGDGKLDVAVLENNEQTTSSLTVLLGDGKGALNTATTTPLNFNANLVAAR